MTSRSPRIATVPLGAWKATVRGLFTPFLTPAKKEKILFLPNTSIAGRL